MHEALKARGGEMIAACVNAPAAVAAGLKNYPGLPGIVAADPGGAAAERLGITHQNAGTLGKRLAVPANLLIDKNGIVQWAHYARIVMDRPDPAEVLRAVEKLEN